MLRIATERLIASVSQYGTIRYGADKQPVLNTMRHVAAPSPVPTIRSTSPKPAGIFFSSGNVGPKPLKQFAFHAKPIHVSCERVN